MLTLLHHTTEVHRVSSPCLRPSSRSPFPGPRKTCCSWNSACRQRQGQVADQIVLVQLTRAHEDEAFVRQAIAHVRAQSPVPLVHKGFRTTSVLLLGGTCLVLETPYLREDRRGRRGRRRHKRGPYGAGCYPVLEVLGIADRVSPATRSEIALHVVQAASYREAAAMLTRRGLTCDVSHLVRISTATSCARVRAAWLCWRACAGKPRDHSSRARLL